MTKKNKKKNIIFGPIIVMSIITFTIMILSFVLSLFGIEGQVADISNNSLEMSLVSVNNIFNANGIKYLFSNTITNFGLISPIAYLIISFIGVGIADKSGLIKHICKPFKKFTTSVIIFITLMLSIILTFLGEYSFIILLPLIGVIYKYLGRNPMLGIITAFIGITCGYGTGIIYNYDTYSLGLITELAAKVDVDPSFSYNVLSCSYIMIASTIIMALIGTQIITRYIAPKFKKYNDLEDEIVTSDKGLWIVNIMMLVILILVVVSIIPGGILLDNEQPKYIAKLMSNSSPFKEGILLIILFSTMLCGAVYGKITGNIKDKNDYNICLYDNFKNAGYVFVLMFFSSIMISVLEWTNVGVVLSSMLINIVSSINMSGTFLIVVFFIFNILIGIIIPNAFSKWNIMSPLIVPLFMRANITPEFTQFIFSISDGIGKSFSPFFIYFIIMLGLLQKYNEDERKITIVGMIKTILPVLLFLAVVWLVLIVSWNIVGLPLGINTYSTL